VTDDEVWLLLSAGMFGIVMTLLALDLMGYW
jgi:hypothetical protein